MNCAMQEAKSQKVLPFEKEGLPALPASYQMAKRAGNQWLNVVASPC